MEMRVAQILIFSIYNFFTLKIAQFLILSNSSFFQERSFGLPGDYFYITWGYGTETSTLVESQKKKREKGNGPLRDHTSAIKEDIDQ